MKKITEMTEEKLFEITVTQLEDSLDGLKFKVPTEKIDAAAWEIAVLAFPLWGKTDLSLKRLDEINEECDEILFDLVA